MDIFIYNKGMVGISLKECPGTIFQKNSYAGVGNPEKFLPSHEYVLRISP